MVQQIAKTTFLALAIAAARVQAQEFTNINLYSTASCPPDANDLDADSFQLGFVPSTDDKGQQYSSCMKATIGLNDWPKTDNGKYEAWVDTSNIAEGCSLNFYNLPGSEEESNDYACMSLYRKVQRDTTQCGDLDLTGTFGYAYCCGDICNTDILTWPDSKKRDVSAKRQKKPQPRAAKDVTSIKRAPIFTKRDDTSCTINLKSDPYTTYGPQIKMGGEDTCEKDTTTCGQVYTYTTGTELTNTVSHEDSTEIGWSEYVVFSNTFSNGWEHSETESTSYSVSKNIAPEPGHTGYPTFQPLLRCAEADLSGDCSREKLGISDGTICIQKFLEGNIPDGHWLMVTTD